MLRQRGRRRFSVLPSKATLFYEKLLLAIAALACSAQSTSAADPDGIENATPIGIPLNNPSLEYGGVNNGDATLEEHRLGGYRPLYPPYFQRKGNEPQQTYYDKEYYSRGAGMGNLDARLDRRLKSPAAVPAPADDLQVYVVSLDSQSRPGSVVQLPNQLQGQLQVPARRPLEASVQFQSQAQLHSQQHSQQSARGFSNYHAHQQTQSYFYTFKFPSS